MRLDVSYTYDGYFVVSDRFVSAVGGEAAIFIPLAQEPGFSVITTDSVVRFDAERRRTRFENLCASCGRYRSVAGATPTFLLIDRPLPDVISRTDIEFGTGDEKHPLLMVGPGLATRIESERLTGVDLTPIASP